MLAERSVSSIKPTTVAMWFLVAVLEGIDLQSAGIAGPGLRETYALAAAQMKWVFTSSTFGLVLGAALGGPIADRIGRKPVLISAVAIFGLFSLATTWAWDYHSLLAARLLTGLGLGAAIPNLIALVFESSPEQTRNTIVAAIYTGMPLGSALASAIAWIGLDRIGWHVVFYAGGIAPLMIVPLLMKHLPESPVYLLRKTTTPGTAPTGRPATRTVLFGPGLAPATLALWVASFFTYFVMYMLINWLPILLVDRGFSPSNSSVVLVLFNLGGAVGILAGGFAMDRRGRGALLALAYAGAAVSLWALGRQTELVALLAAAFAADFCATFTQMAEYSLGSLYYPARSRASGVGIMVAVGRTGSIVGPLAAGQMLAAGATAASVLTLGIPGLIVSGGALLAVLYLRPPRQAPGSP